MNAIFGGGSCVTNTYSVDTNTGNIYIAATAEDAEDGTVDGPREYGLASIWQRTSQ